MGFAIALSGIAMRADPSRSARAEPIAIGAGGPIAIGAGGTHRDTGSD